MEKTWQCPRCQNINIKSDYVVRLSEAWGKLGLTSVGTENEPQPKCSQCNLEIDTRELIEGKYDSTEVEPPSKEKPETKEKRSSALTRIFAGKERVPVLVAGLMVVVCLCAVGLAAGLFLMRAGTTDNYPSDSSPLAGTESPAPTFTSTPNATDASRPIVTILDKAAAQKMVEEGNIESLNSAAEEKYTSEELNQVGVPVRYTIYLTESEPLSWGTNWCTTTKDILLENFEHIRVTFTLDGVEIPLDRFVKVEYPLQDSTGYCRAYYTVLVDWPDFWQGGEILIKTVVTFDQPINDGWDDYPAGDMIREFKVTLLP